MYTSRDEVSGPPVVASLDTDFVSRRVLVEHNGWPRERLLAYQRDKLTKALRHAVDASPYYRETIGELVAREAPLADFPVVTTRVLMDNFDRIATDPRLTRALVERHLAGQATGELLLGQYRVAATGSAAGERSLFAYNKQAWLSLIANLVRLRTILGTPATKVIGIGAPSSFHLSNRINAELRGAKPDVPVLDVTMPMARVVDALNAYRPEAVTTYPSFIRLLALEQKSGRLHVAPRLFRSSAETLPSEVRDLAREVWNAPVIDTYSTTEVGVMGQECEPGSGMHLAEDLALYEVADDENRPVLPGVQGAKLLVTTFANPALPLVRYEITDLVTLTDGPCRCGSPFARISSIAGKRAALLRFPTKGGGFIEVPFVRLRSPLIGTDGIRQFQLTRLPDGLAVSITVIPEFDPEVTRLKAEAAVRSVLEKMGTAPLDLDVRVVDEIERVGAAAKEKPVADSSHGAPER